MAEQFNYTNPNIPQQHPSEMAIGIHSSAEETMAFESYFLPEEQEINDFLSRMFVDPNDPSQGRKYSTEEINTQKWKPEDVDYAKGTLIRKSAAQFFLDMSTEYETGRYIANSSIRLKEVESATKTLNDSVPLLVRGGRRSGKTTFLDQLSDKYGKASSIFVDFDTIPEKFPDFKTNFYNNLTDEVAEIIVTRELEKEKNIDIEQLKSEMQNAKKNPLAYLDTYLENNNQQGPVIITFDEVRRLANDPDKLQFFANTLKDLKHVHSAVVLHRVYEYEALFQKAFEGFNTYFMEPLSDEDIVTLVENPLDGTKITFTAEAINAIRDASGGRPLEIQALCNRLFSRSKEERHSFMYRTVDIRNIANETIDIGIYNSDGSPGSNVIDCYRHIYMYSLGEDERKFINDLIQKKEIPVSEVDSIFVQGLIDMTLVTKDEQNEMYRINGYLFSEVIPNMDKYIDLNDPNSLRTV